ncbi:MAG TPA: hypothetical protein VGK00_14015 [Anaerolineales bacterium]|jgi:hypothetical protein
MPGKAGSSLEWLDKAGHYARPALVNIVNLLQSRQLDSLNTGDT